LEKARPSSRQYVIIASDCLYAKDTTLFRQFITAQKISIFIRHLPTDSIERMLKNQKVNTHFDMVILQTLYDIAHFEKLGFLQRIPNNDMPVGILPQFTTQSNKWIAFGVDPYVIVSTQDSAVAIHSYNDFFKRMDWSTDLIKNAQIVPLYASFLNHGIQKKQVASWLKQHVSVMHPLPEDDSTFTANYLLTNLSTYQTLKQQNKSPFIKKQLIVPENHQFGIMYNLHCFGIVKQARNYTNALNFMHAFIGESMNLRVAKYLKIESVYDSTNPVFKAIYRRKKSTKYTTCLPYFGVLNQLVTSLKKE